MGRILPSGRAFAPKTIKGVGSGLGAKQTAEADPLINRLARAAQAAAPIADLAFGIGKEIDAIDRRETAQSMADLQLAEAKFQAKSPEFSEAARQSLLESLPADAVISPRQKAAMAGMDPGEAVDLQKKGDLAAQPSGPAKVSEAARRQAMIRQAIASGRPLGEQALEGIEQGLATLGKPRPQREVVADRSTGTLRTLPGALPEDRPTVSSATRALRREAGLEAGPAPAPMPEVLPKGLEELKSIAMRGSIQTPEDLARIDRHIDRVIASTKGLTSEDYYSGKTSSRYKAEIRRAIQAGKVDAFKKAEALEELDIKGRDIARKERLAEAKVRLDTINSELKELKLARKRMGRRGFKGFTIPQLMAMGMRADHAAIFQGQSKKVQNKVIDKMRMDKESKSRNMKREVDAAKQPGRTGSSDLSPSQKDAAALAGVKEGLTSLGPETVFDALDPSKLAKRASLRQKKAELEERQRLRSGSDDEYAGQ